MSGTGSRLGLCRLRRPMAVNARFYVATRMVFVLNLITGGENLGEVGVHDARSIYI